MNVPTWLNSQNYRVGPHMVDRDALKKGGFWVISVIWKARPYGIVCVVSRGWHAPTILKNHYKNEAHYNRYNVLFFQINSYLILNNFPVAVKSRCSGSYISLSFLVTLLYILHWWTCRLVYYTGKGAVMSVIAWIYNYLCHQCLSPLTLWVRIPLMVRCTLI